MAMVKWTQPQVETALRNLGRYRCQRAQELANVGLADAISGAHLLALGLRETGLKNIRGGIIRRDGQWVEQPDFREQDVGFTQISEMYHLAALRAMPGVKEGTWGPVVEGKSAADDGYCMRFTDAVRYTIDEMHEAIAFAEERHVNPDSSVRFAIAAHNAGEGGAFAGYKAKDIDKYTTGGDYSRWVLAHVPLIRSGLDQLKWRI